MVSATSKLRMAHISRSLNILCIFVNIITVFNLHIVHTFDARNTVTIDNVHYLQPGIRFSCCKQKILRQLEIYCYTGKAKNVVHLFQTALMHLDLNSDQYEQYDGSSPADVTAEYDHHRSSWSINLYSWKRKEIKLDPFNQSCVGIDTKENYGVHLSIIRVDYWRVLLLCLGVLLFLSAPNLSGNSLFYYMCGISVGVFASFLILVYLVSKLLPRRPLMYGFVVGGWTVGVYLLQMLWENLRLILQQYQNHVLAYTGVTGLLSFVVCYRLGPPSDPRSKNLIKWALQGIGLTMVFLSSSYREAVVTIVVGILVVNNFPKSWSSSIVACWNRRFPPKVPLLTEDEYNEQSVRETSRGLDDLRNYCSSPDCNAWKTVLRIKDPIRFAEFINGGSHLNDEEMLNYEMEARRTVDEYYTDDDSDSE